MTRRVRAAGGRQWRVAQAGLGVKAAFARVLTRIVLARGMGFQRHRFDPPTFRSDFRKPDLGGDKAFDTLPV